MEAQYGSTHNEHEPCPTRGPRDAFGAPAQLYSKVLYFTSDLLFLANDLLAPPRMLASRTALCRCHFLFPEILLYSTTVIRQHDAVARLHLLGYNAFWWHYPILLLNVYQLQLLHWR